MVQFVFFLGGWGHKKQNGSKVDIRCPLEKKGRHRGGPEAGVGLR